MSKKQKRHAKMYILALFTITKVETTQMSNNLGTDSFKKNNTPHNVTLFNRN